jgi:hypothetical protein
MYLLERRNFLKLPLAAGAAILATGALSAQPASAATSLTVPTTKTTGLKGMGYGGTEWRTGKRLGQVNLDWYYNWSPAYGPYPKNFVPMIRDNRKLDRDLAKFTAQLSETKSKILLGFNEPDHKAQANLTVDQVIALWPRLEATGMRLGSPATISPNSDWMNEFMTKAKKLGLRVDFVTMHCYQWPKASSFFAKLDTLHDKWGLPVWVTEYAVADWNATPTKKNIYSRNQVNEFMEETVKGMREREFVERFAWKTRVAGDPVMASSTIYQTNGALTSTGKLYASL